MTSAKNEIQAPASIVQGFLYALRDKDWDTFAAAADDNIVYDNVGTPIRRGRDRTVKFLQRMFDRPSAGFDVKIHRIAAEGTSVLTERTDVMVFGPFRMHFSGYGGSRCTTAGSRCGATISTTSTCSRARYAG